MKEAKDIHPRTEEFSFRDWQTGWAFPEVRAFAWRLGVDCDATKHAIVRIPDEAMEALAIAAFGTVGTGRPPARVSVCGRPTRHTVDIPWHRIEYMNAARCYECLRLIGAPDPKEHLYQWTVPPPRVRKPHAPKEQGHTPFNSETNRGPLTLEDKAAIRAEEQYRGVGADLARRYGVSESTIFHIRNGSKP